MTFTDALDAHQALLDLPIRARGSHTYAMPTTPIAVVTGGDFITVTAAADAQEAAG